MKPMQGSLYVITPSHGQPFLLASAESRHELQTILADHAPFKIRTVPNPNGHPLYVERIPNDIRPILADRKTRRRVVRSITPRAGTRAAPANLDH